MSVRRGITFLIEIIVAVAAANLAAGVLFGAFRAAGLPLTPTSYGVLLLVVTLAFIGVSVLRPGGSLRRS